MGTKAWIGATVVGLMLAITFIAGAYLAYGAGYDNGYVLGNETGHKQGYIEAKILREFQSEEELRNWLAQNNVSEFGRQNETFECDRFSELLVLDAFRDGYIIYSTAGNILNFGELEYYTYTRTYIYPRFSEREIVFADEFKWHAWNYCFINGSIYWIEPQTDQVFNTGWTDR